MYLALALSLTLHLKIQMHFVERTDALISAPRPAPPPRLPSVHRKTICSLFPPWWLPLTYAEVRLRQNNLLLSFMSADSPFPSIKSQQLARRCSHIIMRRSDSPTWLTGPEHRLHISRVLSAWLWANSGEILAGFQHGQRYGSDPRSGHWLHTVIPQDWNVITCLPWWITRTQWIMICWGGRNCACGCDK